MLQLHTVRLLGVKGWLERSSVVVRSASVLDGSFNAVHNATRCAGYRPSSRDTAQRRSGPTPEHGGRGRSAGPCFPCMTSFRLPPRKSLQSIMPTPDSRAGDCFRTYLVGRCSDAELGILTLCGCQHSWQCGQNHVSHTAAKQTSRHHGSGNVPSGRSSPLIHSMLVGSCPSVSINSLTAFQALSKGM